jgi:hypothetical protein
MRIFCPVMVAGEVREFRFWNTRLNSHVLAGPVYNHDDSCVDVLTCCKMITRSDMHQHLSCSSQMHG